MPDIKKLLLSVGVCLFVFIAHSQCTTTINRFPYSEDFEVSDGKWTAGGAASDWAWGAPEKQVIQSAASGSKCWITGTLNRGAYNNNENATLTSPCFDFSTLTNPYIKFNLFWETERKYDGATFQYSTDGGITWTALGSYNDYVQCPSGNWFNTSYITALGSEGWSGNIQAIAQCSGGAGYGSGKWILAQHEMSKLGGKASVRFRFRFAAGNVCNNYDGFAIDDIWIGEAPPVGVPDFSYSCNSTKTVMFSASASGCASFLWNFGDAASSSNLSTASNPSHVYSQAGVYTITLTATIAGIDYTLQKTITVIDVNATEVTPIQCFGDQNGSVTAIVLPAGNYTYQWNTAPVQNTQSLSGLGAGSYQVLVSGQAVCAASAKVVLAQPSRLQHQVVVSDALCNGANGKASITETGGAAPYTYSWSPAGGPDASAINLLPDSYNVMVTDSKGCIDPLSFVVKNTNPLNISLGADTLICPGEKLRLYPGSFVHYLWQDGSADTAFTVMVTGIYSVRVKDSNGCSADARVKVTVDCSDIYFPSAFTPNSDGLNDDFGAAGNIASVTHYGLLVFNRWGEIVFATGNPYQRWNGSQQGKQNPTNVYVWTAHYFLRGKEIMQRGTVTIIR